MVKFAQLNGPLAKLQWSQIMILINYSNSGRMFTQRNNEKIRHKKAKI